jgi:tetratricopeptide (TPR) repeat protein/NAD-dependent dihydropyrimidine dehydrogenase PreA subunit
MSHTHDEPQTNGEGIGRSVTLPVLESRNSGAPMMGRTKRARWRAGVLALVNVLMIIHIIQWLIMGMTVSPVEPSEAMETLEVGVVNAGAIFFLIAILSTLLLGRFFCGWGCHVLALQDLCVWIMTRLGIRPKPFRSRLLVYFPIGLGFYMFIWPSFKRIVLAPALEAASIDWPHWLRPVEPIHQLTSGLIVDDFWATFPAWYIAIPFLLICGFACVYFLGAKGFCTYGCPYAAFFKPIDTVSPTRIRVNDDCGQCGYCTSVCTSNVRVSEEVRDFGMVVDPGCMKTLDCISACPNDALSIGFGSVALGAKPKAESKDARKAALKKRRGRYDLTLWEEGLAAALMLWFFYATRGVFDAIPMLLAGGLAAICTMILVLTIKLFHQPNVRLYKFQFKKQGRIRTVGYGLLLTGVVFAAGSVWASNAKFLRWRGDMQFNQSIVPGDTLVRMEYDPSPAERERAEIAVAAYQRADAPEHGGIGWALNAELRLRLSYFLSMLDRHGEAFEQLRMVIEDGEPTDSLVLQASQVLIRSMDDARNPNLGQLEHEEAKRVAILELYSDAIQAHPHLHAIRAELAKSAAVTGDREGADRYWDIAWQVQRYSELADAYEAQGNEEDAAEAREISSKLADFVEVAKTEPRFILSRAAMHGFIGEMDEAQRLFRLASENATNDMNPAGVWIDIGRTVMQFGLQEFAREQAQKAIDSPDASTMTWVAAAEIASFSGAFDLGRERAEQAMTMPRFGDQPMLMARAANAMLTRDNLEPGIALLRRGVETSKDPFEQFTIARGMAAGGMSLGSNEMLEEGLEYIEGIVRSYPELALIQSDLGNIYYQLGRFESAERHTIESAERSSHNAALADRATELYRAMGREDEARVWEQEAQRRREAAKP